MKTCSMSRHRCLPDAAISPNPNPFFCRVPTNHSSVSFWLNRNHSKALGLRHRAFWVTKLSPGVFFLVLYISNSWAHLSCWALLHWHLGPICLLGLQSTKVLWALLSVWYGLKPHSDLCHPDITLLYPSSTISVLSWTLDAELSKEMGVRWIKSLLLFKHLFCAKPCD